jgi:hypothetical protein
MDAKSYKSKISLNQISKIESLVENICQEHNISCYYGAIVVSIEQILDLIISYYGSAFSNKVISFYFEQCVGGISFSVECEDEIFSQYIFNKDMEMDEDTNLNVFLISRLSDQVIITEEGRKVEVLFFVNGIQPELLVDRQEKIKQFNLIRMHQNI